MKPKRCKIRLIFSRIYDILALKDKSRGKFRMSEKAIYAILSGIGGIFMPLNVLLSTVFIFVIVDTVTGILAAKKRGEIICSSKLKKIISKLLSYSIVIFLFQLIDAWSLPFWTLHAAQITTAIICAVDGYSVLENLYCITGNRVFYILTQFTVSKVREKIGVDIENKDAKQKTIS